MEGKIYSFYNGKSRFHITEESTSGNLDRGAKTRKILVDMQERKRYFLRPCYRKNGNTWETRQDCYKVTVDNIKYKVYPKDTTIVFYRDSHLHKK